MDVVVFFVSDHVWKKVFLKTNEGKSWFLKISGHVCTRPKAKIDGK